MEFYTVREVATRLRLSVSLVYGLVKGGRLGCHRFTRSKQGAIRVSDVQLREYLTSTEEAETTAGPLLHLR